MLRLWCILWICCVVLFPLRCSSCIGAHQSCTTFNAPPSVFAHVLMPLGSEPKPFLIHAPSHPRTKSWTCVVVQMLQARSKARTQHAELRCQHTSMRQTRARVCCLSRELDEASCRCLIERQQVLCRAESLAGAARAIQVCAPNSGDTVVREGYGVCKGGG